MHAAERCMHRRQEGAPGEAAPSIASFSLTPDCTRGWCDQTAPNDMQHTPSHYVRSALCSAVKLVTARERYAVRTIRLHAQRSAVKLFRT
eukprot:2297028-Prymnesium_polylepis.1